METMSSIPNAVRSQKYISLKTFRKSGAPVETPVWFGEEDGKLYVMTRSDMGKTKRIRNSPKSASRALHYSRPSHWTRISGYRTHFAARGLRSRTKNTDEEVLAGETHRAVLAGGRIFRDQL